jgi:signal transduction histidine kinase
MPARPAAARAGNSRSSFLRMASHELRTPLNSIIGFSELISCELYGPVGAPQYKEYADIIHDSGKRLLRMVNQVLEVVKLQESAADLDPAPQALDEVVQDALAALTPDAQAREVEVVVEPLPRGLSAQADARGIRTILANLLQNAVTFSPDGGEVRISARRRGGMVEVLVSDTGGGVPIEDIPRLLRPFEQGENAPQGAGLGLTIVRLLCDAMDGSLALDSRPGEGLTAVVTLPAAPAGHAIKVAGASRPS